MNKELKKRIHEILKELGEAEDKLNNAVYDLEELENDAEEDEKLLKVRGIEELIYCRDEIEGMKDSLGSITYDLYVLFKKSVYGEKS